MARDPVENDADARLVARVDERLELPWPAEPAGGRVETGDLIAPGTQERVLHHRHELDVRVAHFLDVRDEPRRELRVGENAIPIFRDVHPRREVHLVGRHRFVEPGVGGGPGDQPLRVVPRVVQARHDGGGQGRYLEGESEGIGLQQQFAMEARPDLELVAGALGHAGDEDFPDAGRAEPPHRVQAAVPRVDVADDADAIGVRRPHREVDAVGVANPHQVRAQLVVNAGVLPLREQVHVVLRDHPAVAIRIVDVDGMAARIGDPETIVEDPGRVRERRLEYAGVVARHRRRATGAHDVDALRRRLVRADDDAPALDVGPEDRERIGMARAREGVEVGVTCHSQRLCNASAPACGKRLTLRDHSVEIHDEVAGVISRALI